MRKFRFQYLEIWKEAISIAVILFGIADSLEEKKLWRFADQLRGVGMSIPNNISESTGTHKILEQQQLLRYSKRECYEAANIIIILELISLLDCLQKVSLIDRLHILSSRIQAYSNSLNK